jgi:radical SAM protein with 4Fe4S-binding SPASM domain
MDCPQIDTLNQPGLFERLKDENKRVPLSGSLEVTFRCNLRCAHCYIGDNRSGAPEKCELSKEEIFGILDQVTDAGTLWFLLTGGEPFIRPDFLEIYRYAVRKGLILSIFTNGTLLTPSTADELADLPPRLIEITLYGRTQATYERITGIKGSHTRCMQGIDLLLKRGLPLMLKTMVTQWNRHEFEDIRAFATGLGVDFRYDPLLIGSLDAKQEPFALRLSPEEVVDLEMPNLQLKDEMRAMLERTAGKPLSPFLYQCSAAMNTYHIDPYGQLSPCILSRARSYNLRSGAFKEGWEVFLQQVRAQPGKTQERCTGCNLLTLCAQCPGKSNLENGNQDELVNYFCQVGRLRAASLGANLE